MEELALHLLDLIQNSIEAGATRIDLRICLDPAGDWLDMVLRDNGRGMDSATANAVFDPFFTTRKTRRVGLGLPLVRATAEATGGSVTIESAPGQGTSLTAKFGFSHIDCPPLGDLAATLTTVFCMNPQIEICYQQARGVEQFELTTQQLKDNLGETPLGHPAVFAWLREYLGQQTSILYGGARR